MVDIVEHPIVFVPLTPTPQYPFDAISECHFSSIQSSHDYYFLMLNNLLLFKLCDVFVVPRVPTLSLFHTDMQQGGSICLLLVWHYLFA